MSGIKHPTIRRPVTAVAIPRMEVQVVRERGKPVERRITLDGDTLRVGSHPGNEIVVDDRTVSRFHCTLRCGLQRWSVTDSDSANGTLVNGVPVRDADLPEGTCDLTLGNSTIRLIRTGHAGVTTVPESSSFGDLYGESLAIRQVFVMLTRVAETDSTVLLEGESGTGKELAATEVVQRGARADKPFLIIDCGAISPNVIESELFGHAKGAFTGAERARVGAFEEADGGTLFLDEIGEMPLEMQPKLLRALESGQVRRVGENQFRKVDVRVIAATNRQLQREVNRGRFREDLYFRLSVVSVQLPPLRQRLEDIPLLVDVLLSSMNAEESKHLFDAAALAQMAQYDWPGNVRELRNYVERAVVLHTVAPAPSSQRAPDELAGDGSADPDEPNLDVPFKLAKDQHIESFELAYLSALMKWADGNVSRAARRAKMDRMYLHRLLQRRGLHGRSTRL